MDLLARPERNRSGRSHFLGNRTKAYRILGRLEEVVGGSKGKEVH